MRTIQIEAVCNGFIAQVGCQRVVFESKTKLLVELGRYLDNPTAIEEEYLKSEQAKLASCLSPVPVPATTLTFSTGSVLGQSQQSIGAYGSIGSSAADILR